MSLDVELQCRRGKPVVVNQFGNMQSVGLQLQLVAQIAWTVVIGHRGKCCDGTDVAAHRQVCGAILQRSAQHGIQCDVAQLKHRFGNGEERLQQRLVESSHVGGGDAGSMQVEVEGGALDVRQSDDGAVELHTGAVADGDRHAVDFTGNLDGVVHAPQAGCPIGGVAQSDGGTLV